MKRLFLYALVIVIFILLHIYVFAGSITIEWTPNIEPDLAGYKIHYGLSSNNYTEELELLGNITTYTIDELIPNTYYIAVTAFDTSGLVSGYSNEVIETVNNLPPSNPVGCNVIDVVHD